MKTLSKVGVIFALAGSLFLSSCASDYYVADQPVEPVYVRPVAPYAGAYWVPGEWIYRSNRYVYRSGYYVRPRTNHIYVRGNWVHTNRGYAWRRGYWRR